MKKFIPWFFYALFVGALIYGAILRTTSLNYGQQLNHNRNAHKDEFGSFLKSFDDEVHQPDLRSRGRDNHKTESDEDLNTYAERYFHYAEDLEQPERGDFRRGHTQPQP